MAKNIENLPTKKIYIIRHGETDYNLKGIVQGSGIDASLNTRGMEQAARFYTHYKDLGFEKVYTSTLKRTIQSVSGFIDDGITHAKLDGLDEINWGHKEGKQVSSEDNVYYKELVNAWKNGRTSLKIEGGESPDDVADRQQKALNQIINGSEEKILVSMHGRALRILLCLMLSYPIRCMDNFEHSNLCLYKVDFTGTLFRLALANNTDHLNDTK